MEEGGQWNGPGVMMGIDGFGISWHAWLNEKGGFCHGYVA
jgi:hypothetical protein